MCFFDQTDWFKDGEMRCVKNSSAFLLLLEEKTWWFTLLKLNNILFPTYFWVDDFPFSLRWVNGIFYHGSSMSNIQSAWNSKKVGCSLSLSYQIHSEIWRMVLILGVSCQNAIHGRIPSILALEDMKPCERKGNINHVKLVCQIAHASTISTTMFTSVPTPCPYMQGICTCIYHESKPNADKYTVPCMDGDMDTLLRRLLDL